MSQGTTQRKWKTAKAFFEGLVSIIVQQGLITNAVARTKEITKCLPLRFLKLRWLAMFAVVFAVGPENFSQQGGGEQAWILGRTPESNWAVGYDWLKRFRPARRVEPLLSSHERSILKQMGASYLADTYVVLSSQKTMSLIQEYIKNKKLPFYIESSNLQIKTTSLPVEPFEDRQWALQNTGERQRFDIDQITPFQTPGRPDQDIRPVHRKSSAKKIRVAILDTGMDTSHPDLKSKVYRKPSECQAREHYRSCLEVESTAWETCSECRERRSVCDAVAELGSLAAYKKKCLELSAEDPESRKLGCHTDSSIAWERCTDCQMQRDRCELVLAEKSSSEYLNATCARRWLDVKQPDVDQDNNGYPLDCEGWAVDEYSTQSDSPFLRVAGILGRPFPDDLTGHGTHVAGIVGAARNGQGIRGCSENVEIIPVRVLSENPKEPKKPLSLSPLDNENFDINPQEGQRQKIFELGDGVARGLIYAYHNGAQVVNFSLGWPEARDSKFMRYVVQEVQKKGVIVVAAAGNDSTYRVLRPCAYPGVLCVGAHGPDGAVSFFSNYGMGVDMTAPGQNILSTWPRGADERLRPRRFREIPNSSDEGTYEYLHGTSQAAPFVTCAAAELLAAGVPSQDVYPRLMASSRAHLEALPPVSRMPHMKDGDTLATYKFHQVHHKYTRGGMLDIQRALAAKPRPLILPLQRAVIASEWNGKDRMLTWHFQLKNYWADTTDDVRVSGQIVYPKTPSIQPVLRSISPAKTYPKRWKRNEVREWIVQMEVPEARSGESILSRINGQFTVELSINDGRGGPKASWLQGEIIVPVDEFSDWPGLQRLVFKDFPKGRPDLKIIDQVNDSYKDYVDYALIQFGGREWSLQLVSQDREKDPQTASYTLSEEQTFPLPNGVSPQAVLQGFKLRQRIDLDNDGQSEYVLGFKIQPRDKPPKYFVYILDSRFKRLREHEFEIKYADFAISRLRWLAIDGVKHMAWISTGFTPSHRFSRRELWKLRQVWSSPDFDKDQLLQHLPYQNHLYFLDQKGELKTMLAEGYEIIDVLDPTPEQEQKGHVPLLLAEDTGNLEPSYVRGWFTAVATESGINAIEPLVFVKSNGSRSYRDLTSVKVGSLFSLSPAEPLSGTYWFGSGKYRQQRLSVWLSEGRVIRNLDAKALRQPVDSALMVRRAFVDKNGGVTAFVLTNTDIQFHDFAKEQVESVSQERYSFYGDGHIAVYTGGVVASQTDPSQRLPALFIPETARLSRSRRLVLPVYDVKTGELLELAEPARFRLKSRGACRSTEAVLTLSTGSYLDYLCQKDGRTEVLRVPQDW